MAVEEAFSNWFGSKQHLMNFKRMYIFWLQFKWYKKYEYLFTPIWKNICAIDWALSWFFPVPRNRYTICMALKQWSVGFRYLIKT